MTPEQFIKTFSHLFIQVRRELHQIPELGTKEIKTGAKIMQYLDQWHIPYLYPRADTGIVAMIRGGKSGSGNVLALRADMDALPLTESITKPCRSLHKGRMHACGHDVHMAIALGTAYYFKKIQQEFSGCIKIFFQPAEETIGGAMRMIQEGCMKHPQVDYVAGLHVAPGIDVGEIEVKYGKLYAASDEVHITVTGKSCHGAYPDLGTDAIAIAGTLISSLQSTVSRIVSPLDQAVLSLGTIHGGTAHNIIADRVDITGTLRTTDPKTRDLAKEYIKQQVTHVAAAYGGLGETVITPGYNALINSDCVVDVLLDVATPILGKEHIQIKASPGMGVEDFSFFLEKAPGLFYHLGCGNKAKGITAPLHSENFEIDEDCLALGIRLQIMLSLALLKHGL